MDQLEQALAAARARDEHAQALNAALRNTLATPMLIERIVVSLVALRYEEDDPILAIALPTGKRIDLELTDSAVSALFENLARKAPAAETAEDEAGGG